jgi:putative peptide zinc metalloprotease protein
MKNTLTLTKEFDKNLSSDFVPIPDDRIQLSPFDDGRGKNFLLQIDKAYYKIPACAYELIRLIDGSRNVSVITLELQKKGFDVNETTVKKIIVELTHHKDRPDPLPASSRRSFVYGRFRLFSQKQIRPVARILQFLFHNTIFAALGTLELVFLIFYNVLHESPETHWTTLGFSEIVLLYGVILLTLVIHEFGHATACTRFRANHGEIGFGVYLFMPVLYADVTDIWRLTRRERLTVNSGGIYFQLLCLPFLYIGYAVSDRDLFLNAMDIISFMAISSLNPFLRFDGYWILTDFAKTPNLKRRAFDLVANSIKGIWSQKRLREKFRQRGDIIVISYTLLSCCFFCFLTYRVLSTLTDVFSSYPNALASIWMYIFDQNDFKLALNKANEFLLPTLLLGGIGALMINAVKTSTKRFFQKFR